MTREQLLHILRAASKIASDDTVIVFGSQAILASYTNEILPPETTHSIEADITFFNDEQDIKSDQVDGAIGELSQFHQTFGIYAQGVSINTAVLPDGWRDRVVTVDIDSGGHGLCLEPHDLAISKLVANRDKDREFVQALINSNLVDKKVLFDRAMGLVGRDRDRDRIVEWLKYH